ncbi:MAG: DUF1289 domain-containing protein [Magnetovibrionaceae bacterium]
MTQSQGIPKPQGPKRSRSLDQNGDCSPDATVKPKRLQGGPKGVKVRPASPCISVCVMDEKIGLCQGCQRTIDEITRWGTMAPAERDRVWVLIDERRGL